MRLSRIVYTALALLLVGGVSAKAQTTPVPLQGLQTGAGAVGIVLGSQTVTGADETVTLPVTTNFGIDGDSLQWAASSGNAMNLGEYGGFHYYVPLSKLVKNLSYVNQIQLAVTGSLGVIRVNDAAGNVSQHMSGLAGIRLDWVKNSLDVNLLQVRYADMPGLSSTAILVQSGVGIKLPF